MTSDELRQAFIRFFEEKGHLAVSSSSLVPEGDPTLLFTNAGMVQLKPYFLGEARPPAPRLTSCQKCYRTTDIEVVGDTSHLTFFEMLGNFSVGDYFKREAIGFAWEFVTERLKLPAERLWITIFVNDDEAFQFWREKGIPAERIVRYGEAEGNFWGPAGETGPCGPCSEIHYDFGEEFSCGKPDCGPGCSCGRFLEIWNLVFTEYYQDEEGRRTPLLQRNIDTGMGLERVTAVMQGSRSVYDADIFAPLIAVAEKIAGRRYGEDVATDRAMRVMAEHGRGLTFLISDGVLPSNEGRGYVLRRVLRRAVRYARTLGVTRPFLADLTRATIDKMGHVYPDLIKNRALILRVLEAEEIKFQQTLTTGLNLLDQMIEHALRQGQRVIAGDDVFRLYDTYGFPKELTAEVAAERGLTIDLRGFEAAMERQRERARAAHRFTLAEREALERYINLGIQKTLFVGYERLEAESTILAMLMNGQPADVVGAGQMVEVILAETPLYAEGGGQVGDKGELIAREGRMQVVDTIKPLPDLTVHRGTITEGYLAVGDTVQAIVDKERRLDIMRNHTATHLLHAALRRVLGPQALQAGSLVAPDRFRFDFSHPVAMTLQEIQLVEDLVNEKIREDLPVRPRLMPYQEAQAIGAMALFGEKYGDVVRVVQIGGNGMAPAVAGGPEPPLPFSRELCGGTHVGATGEIGYFHITGESSIGAGMRRIEAVTGRGAAELFRRYNATLEQVSVLLQTPSENVPERLSSVLEELAVERRRSTALQRELWRKEAEVLLNRSEVVDGSRVLAARVEAPNVDTMREMGDWLRDHLGSGIIALGSVIGDRPNFVVMVTPDLVKKGFHAGKIVKQIAAVVGGGGGGRPEMAQAGGKDKAKLNEALEIVPQIVKGRETA